jgi:outer membrane protein assembly factor BamE (lipoprotein component of BamABCDE complex)
MSHLGSSEEGVKMRYKKLVCLTAVLFLAGCATLRGTRELVAKTEQLQKGVSTKEDVRRILGKPIHVSHNEDGSAIYVYELVLGRTKFFHGPVSEVTRARVILDPQGILRDYTIDELFYDGPYYQTAAEAAAAEAQQAAAAANANQQKQNSYNTYNSPYNTYKPYSPGKH